MDFSLTPDQVLLRDTAQKLLERECPPSLVRAHIDDPAAYEPLWRHLSEYVGLAHADATDACLFLEQTGYAAAPGPFLATLLFQSLTGEESTGTVVTTPYTLEVDRVDRVAYFSPDGMVVVDAAAVSASFVTTVDYSRRVFNVDVPTAAPALEWSARAYTFLAAEMVGVSRRIFDMALQYAKERYQFDVPIGSFQAIQHKLADMSLALERATAAVHYAAMTIDADDADRERAAHVAKAAAGVAARRILKDGIQIHGGIGYTWEHDLHLYLRRATADEYLLGTTGWHHDRLADLVIGPAR
jgi:acyl-CoA dehydrogenase-like protein